VEKIKQTFYGEIKEFIKSEKIHVPTFVYSVLDGYIKGEVYAESILYSTVLIETQNGIYFVCGSEKNEGFNQDLINLYREKKSANFRFTLFSSSKKWNSILNHLLKNEIKQLRRYSYNLGEGNELLGFPKLPKDYYIDRITPGLIEVSYEFNKKYYEEYWGSVSNFLDKGFGYCILYNNEVVSECTAIFCSDDYAEIDIATRDNYRGKGLANILANTFIKHSLEYNIRPSWDCDVSNNSSINLADKLGFIDPIEYSIFV
jgi:RimJ/RimL family protein N-acetyltransferase